MISPSFLNLSLKFTHDSIFVFLDFVSTESVVENLLKARAYELNFDMFQNHNMVIAIHLIEV